MSGFPCRAHRSQQAGCVDCRDLNTRYDRRRRRRIAEGTWLPKVHPDHLRAHLHSLQAAGMSLAAVARAANVAPHTVYPILNKNRSYVQGPTAAAILAVEPPTRPVLPRGMVDAVGTARRIRALTAIGYPLSTQADMLGWILQRVWELGHGRHQACTQVTHDAVSDLFERLSATPASRSAGATRARNDARRRGWFPPHAWDDIDDPDCQPALDVPAADPHFVDEVAVTRALRGFRTQLTTAEVLATVRAAMARGSSLTRICDRLSVNRNRIARLLAEKSADEAPAEDGVAA